MMLNLQRIGFGQSGMVQEPGIGVSASGVEIQNDQSTLNATTLYISCPAGGSLAVLWGDGTQSAVTCDGTLKTLSHSYAATGKYVLRVMGTVDKITDFRAYSQAWLSGDIAQIVRGFSTALKTLWLGSTSITGNISALSGLTGLTDTRNNSTSLSGNVSALSGLTSLVTCYFASTSLTGDVSSIATLTALSAVWLYSTSISDYTTTSLPPWASATIRIDSCGLSSTEVDNFLIDFADGIGAAGTLNIAGTNAARTAASDAAKAAILGAGWALTVNE